MNVYDLVKKAKLGAVKYNGAGSVSVCNGDGAVVCSIPTASKEQEDAVVAYIEHTLNHFMEALEALKDLDNGEDPALRAKIARLETVEEV